MKYSKINLPLTGAALLLAFLILASSVWRATQSAEAIVNSHTDPSSTPSSYQGPEGQTRKTEQIKQKVDYQLAWPGILPDHPLYMLKMIRDRVQGWLTRDPVRKTEWLLLMADKRIYAAKLLLEKGKEQLSSVTALKAEKYLARATEELEKAKQKKGADAKKIGAKLKLAYEKHIMIVEQARQRTTKGSPKFGEAYELLKIIGEKIKTADWVNS